MWKTLPRGGGILDQDPLLMDMFDFAESELAKAQKAEQDKMARKSKRR